MVLGMGALSHAVDPIEISKDIGVSMSVGSQFGFQIWEEEYIRDLGTVAPGIGSTADVHIYATSNNSAPWAISAASTGITGTTQVPPDTLPVEITTYGAGLTGTVYTDLVLTGAPTSIYDACAGEYPIVGLEIGCIVVVNTSQDTLQDDYAGTLTLTMSE